MTSADFVTLKNDFLNFIRIKTLILLRWLKFNLAWKERILTVTIQVSFGSHYSTNVNLHLPYAWLEIFSIHVSLVLLAHCATKFGHIIILHLTNGLNWLCRKWLDPGGIFYYKDHLGFFYFLCMFLILLRAW